MLEIQIIALGRLKESYLKDAVAEYQKRLTTMCSFKITELEPVRLSQNPSDVEIVNALKKEADEILKKAGNSKIIALCVEGKMLSSNELSEFIESAKNLGDSKLSFVIGSSFGLSDEIKSKSILKLSMSKMTFPHQLARVMLSEQIYRAISISEGLKYHK